MNFKVKNWCVDLLLDGVKHEFYTPSLPNWNTHTHIYNLKHSIYCCYTSVETHQRPHHSYHFSLIFYSSSLLICTLLLHLLWPFPLPFISLLLSTLMSFVLDPFLFLLFWLFLSPTSYYKFDSLTCTLYIFSPHKKVYYSLSPFFFFFFFYLFFGGFFFSFFCISTLGW